MSNVDMMNKILQFKDTKFIELKNEVLRCDVTSVRAISYDTYHTILVEIYTISKELGIEV